MWLMVARAINNDESGEKSIGTEYHVRFSTWLSSKHIEDRGRSPRSFLNTTLSRKIVSSLLLFFFFF